MKTPRSKRIAFEIVAVAAIAWVVIAFDLHRAAPWWLILLALFVPGPLIKAAAFKMFPDPAPHTSEGDKRHGL